MTFVAMLLLIGLGLVVQAILNGSLGSLLGGSVFLAVGIYAARLLVREAREPVEFDEDDRMRLVLKASAVMLVLGGGMVWFFTRDS